MSVSQHCSSTSGEAENVDTGAAECLPTYPDTEMQKTAAAVQAPVHGCGRCVQSVMAAAAARMHARPGPARRLSLTKFRPLGPAEKLETLELAPIKLIDGHVKLPGSKSLSNRILLLAALAEGTTTVENLLVRAFAAS